MSRSPCGARTADERDSRPADEPGLEHRLQASVQRRRILRRCPGSPLKAPVYTDGADGQTARPNRPPPQAAPDTSRRYAR